MLGDHESKVTIKKDDLLTTVRANREKHKAEYSEAMKGYFEKVHAEAKKLVAIFDTGGLLDRGPITKLVEPPNHTKAYDRAIRMLEMSVEEVIVISERKFEELVLDEWDWMQQFKNVTSGYAGRR